MNNIYQNHSDTPVLCQHGCGQPATHVTKSSLATGPHKGAPVHQCARSHNSCPAIKQKKINTSLENYGTAYPWQTAEIIEKRKQISIEKYGHACSLLNPDQQAKRKATMMERYGAPEPLLSPEIKAKAAQGIKQSYINDPDLAARQVQTRREKYGMNSELVVEKNRKTQIAKGRWVAPEDRDAWGLYRFEVGRLTSKAYKEHKSLINPDDLPVGLKAYHIDHIYSIKRGFENNIAPEIIAHVSNLRMLWYQENISKHVRCDQTIEELMEKIQGAETP